MTKKILLCAAIAALFSINTIAFASPDFNQPAVETGVLELYGDDFYINDYELEDLSKTQKRQLQDLVGQRITIKGFYETTKHSKQADEIYVSEIIVANDNDNKNVEQVKIYGQSNQCSDVKPDVEDAVKK